LLTLSIADELLDEGLGLKDATPFNVLFRGSRPVFVDVLSIERRNPLDPIWKAAAQFERTFLLPLLAWRHFAMSPSMIFLARRDGIEPEELYRCCGWSQRIRPTFFWSVTLPSLLGRWPSVGKDRFYDPVVASNPERAQYAVRATLRRLRREMVALTPTPIASRWSQYGDACASYSSAELASKENFVREALNRNGCRRVLDIGCNTGAYAILAAHQGASVVAIDRDIASVGDLWERLSREGLNVLPLVVDIARPSPATGWATNETLAFFDRVAGRFDAVLMLALIHHLMVTDRIPLRNIAEVVAGLTLALAVIEYVGPADPLFQGLLRGRGDLFPSSSRESFETMFAGYFDIAAQQQIGADRWIYEMRKRA
jgi:SAM-dependent methyltransferase